jgi:vitamin B12 transporter
MAGVAISALAVASAPGAAQEAFDLDEITVFSNIGGIEADRTGTAVSVLDAEDLQRNGETAVADELNGLPGVSVARNGPVGTQTTVTIRGVNQNNIAVRYEGIDVADPSGTQVAFDFGGLLTGGLGRIDVLRGSQSALFGSQAVGGAILMQGKRASGIGTEVETQLEFGSYGTRQASVDVAMASERGELSFGLGRFRTDGFSAWEENGRPDAEADGYEETRLNLFAAYDLGAATTVEFAGFLIDSEGEFDDNFSGTFFDSANVNRTRKRGARLSVIHDFGAVQVTGTLSRFAIDRELDYSGFILPYEGQRDSARLEAAFALGASIDVVAGIEHKRETYIDTYQSRSTDMNTAFAQAVYAINADNDVTASLRYDDHSAFGGQWTGRLNGAHRLGGGTTLRWSAGTGYRAPSNYELYGFYVDTFVTPPATVLVGDPTLGVEKAQSVDIGIEQQFGNGRVALTAFYLKATDLIDYSFASGTYVQRDGAARRTGIELSGEWDIDDRLRLSGAYTYTDTDIDVALDSSGWSAAVPRHKLALALDWAATERLDLGLDLIASADKPRVDDFVVVNMAAAYEVSDGVEAYLRIENLLDREYQTVAGYGTSDRAAYFGLRASF